jgi:hypothetical protein
MLHQLATQPLTHAAAHPLPLAGEGYEKLNQRVAPRPQAGEGLGRGAMLSSVNTPVDIENDGLGRLGVFN